MGMRPIFMTMISRSAVDTYRLPLKYSKAKEKSRHDHHTTRTSLP
jgi:hypothetical protein